MLLFVALSIIILTIILLLHYNQHFNFKLRCANPEATRRFSATEVDSSGSQIGAPSDFMKRKSSTTRPRMTSVDSVTSFIHDAKHYRCMFTSADDEDYDFFPITFFFYLSFLIIVCILIIIRCFILETYIHFNDTHFVNSSFNNHNLLSTHNIHITHIIDYVLIYSIMIISLWESLFSFYRYYLTYFTSKSFNQPNMCRVFIIFSFYMIVYMILCIVYIHFYYWIFPFIILTHFIFNTVCTYKFANILIESYTRFLSMDTSERNINLNMSVLSSVYFMRKTSLICTILQSLYLALFTIFYNINTIYYMPIIWSISTTIFTLNFVRNREYIYAKLYIYSKYCLCMHRRASDQGRTRNTSRSNRKNSDRHDQVISGTVDLNTAGTVDLKAPPTAVHVDAVTQKPQDSGSSSLVEDLKIALGEAQLPRNKRKKKKLDPWVSSPSVPSLIERQSIVKLPAKNPVPSFSRSANYDLQIRKKLSMQDKAFDILGLSPFKGSKPFKIRLSAPMEYNDTRENTMDISMDASIVIRNTTPSICDTPLTQYSLDIPTPVDEEPDIKLDIVVDIAEEEDDFEIDLDLEDIEEEEPQQDDVKVEEDVNVDQLNLNEVVRSLNVLVTAAFISRQSVNNLKDISRYIHRR